MPRSSASRTDAACGCAIVRAYVCVCVRAYVCVCACVRACVCACVHAGVRARLHDICNPHPVGSLLIAAPVYTLASFEVVAATEVCPWLRRKTPSLTNTQGQYIQLVLWIRRTLMHVSNSTVDAEMPSETLRQGIMPQAFTSKHIMGRSHRCLERILHTVA